MSSHVNVLIADGLSVTAGGMSAVGFTYSPIGELDSVAFVQWVPKSAFLRDDRPAAAS